MASSRTEALHAYPREVQLDHDRDARSSSIRTADMSEIERLVDNSSEEGARSVLPSQLTTPTRPRLVARNDQYNGSERRSSLAAQKLLSSPGQLKSNRSVVSHDNIPYGKQSYYVSESGEPLLGAGVFSSVRLRSALSTSIATTSAESVAMDVGARTVHSGRHAAEDASVASSAISHSTAGVRAGPGSVASAAFPVSAPRQAAVGSAGEGSGQGTVGGPLSHVPLALPAGLLSALWPDASTADPPLSPPPVSLLKSLLPVAAGAGGGADPGRTLNTMSALAMAYRQLELVTTHRVSEVTHARDAAAAATREAQSLTLQLAEATERNGFLAHCYGQLAAAHNAGLEPGVGSVIDQALSLPSLSLLRGEALSRAADRVLALRQETVDLRLSLDSARAALREARVWQGSGTASLREEVSRLCVELSATSALSVARVRQAQELASTGVKGAQEAEEGRVRAEGALGGVQAALGVERSSNGQLRSALSASAARESDLSRQLVWAEEAIRVLKEEIRQRDALIAAQMEALQAPQAGGGGSRSRSVLEGSGVGMDPVTAALTLSSPHLSLHASYTAHGAEGALPVPSLAPVTGPVASGSPGRAPSPSLRASQAEEASLSLAIDRAREESGRAAQGVQGARIARPRPPVRMAGLALDGMETLGTGTDREEEGEEGEWLRAPSPPPGQGSTQTPVWREEGKSVGADPAELQQSADLWEFLQAAETA